jgi:hypothetical protein
VARIKGVPAGHAGPSVKIAYWFTRRHFARLTGRKPERGIEPLQICAHLPWLLRAYGRFEQAVARLHGLGRRADALAELKAATLIRCAFCIDLASQISREWGLSDEELLALPACPRRRPRRDVHRRHRQVPAPAPLSHPAASAGSEPGVTTTARPCSWAGSPQSSPSSP